MTLLTHCPFHLQWSNPLIQEKEYHLPPKKIQKRSPLKCLDPNIHHPATSKISLPPTILMTPFSLDLSPANITSRNLPIQSYSSLLSDFQNKCIQVKVDQTFDPSSTPTLTKIPWSNSLEISPHLPSPYRSALKPFSPLNANHRQQKTLTIFPVRLLRVGRMPPNENLSLKLSRWEE